MPCATCRSSPHSSGEEHGVALLLHCLAFPRPTLEIGCRLSSCGWCYGWEGWGHYMFSRSAISSRCTRGMLLLAACGAQGLHWNLTVWVATRVAGGSTGSGPASTVPHGRSGAACRCWLGTWPHDPLRCGLNSSPSHTDAMCNLPQFANSLRG